MGLVRKADMSVNMNESILRLQVQTDILTVGIAGKGGGGFHTILISLIPFYCSKAVHGSRSCGWVLRKIRPNWKIYQPLKEVQAKKLCHRKDLKLRSNTGVGHPYNLWFDLILVVACIICSACICNFLICKRDLFINGLLIYRHITRLYIIFMRYFFM